MSMFKRNSVGAGVLSLATLLLPTIALGDMGADVREELKEFDTELEEPGHSHLGRGFLDRGLEGYDALRDKANEKHDLDWYIAGSYLYQAHDRNLKNGGKQWLNNFELDLMIAWDLVNSEKYGKGGLTYISSHVWEKRNFTGLGSGATTDEVTESLGSVYKISDSDNLDGRIRQLYWTHGTLDDSFKVHVGQIEIPAFIDDNAYANNDRDKFIAEAWTNTTRSSVNIFGAGAAVGITPSDAYYVRAAFVDGNSNLENPKWSSFSKGEYIYTAELGFTPTIEGWGQGVYRISPWYADEAKLGDEGHGVNISFEQETPWDMALWLRGGVSDNRRNVFKSFLGGGAVFTNPFGFNRDRIGVALGWGKTDNPSRSDDNFDDCFDDDLDDDFDDCVVPGTKPDLVGDTYLLETYWRFQVTERFEFTTDIQLHMKPAKDRGRDVAAVGSLRAMFRL
jgi:hypothetical protein